MAAQEPAKLPLVERLRAQRDRHRRRPMIIRVLYIVVGFTLLGAGAALLVLPGPAFLVLPIGLAILSMEFDWAERLLERAIEQSEIAKQKAAQTTRTQRILVAVAVALGVTAIVAWGLLADIPIVPDP